MSKKKSIEEIFIDAVKLQQNDDYNEAEKLYKKILNINPEVTGVHYNLGLIFQKINKSKKAINSYLRALEIDPNYINAYINMGNIYRESDETKNTINCYEKALSLDPNNEVVLYNLGSVFLEKNRGLVALKYFIKLIQINPNNENGLKNLSILLKSYQLKINDTNYKELKKIFLLLFDRNDINHSYNYHNAIKILLYKNDFIINSSVNKKKLLLENYNIKNLLKEKLFILILQKSIVKDEFFENLLTSLRKELLLLLISNNYDKLHENFEFILSLAEQCFINEYVFNQTKKEIEKIYQLKNSLLKNNKIDEIKFSILGCYIPLYIEQSLIKKLLNYHPKSQLFNNLIDLQINEPLKEKKISKSIKSFGKITNAISKKVKKQYEENPYPRWRYDYTYSPVNFLNVLNFEIKPNKIIKSNKFQNPDILIAGCGTGEHVLMTSNYLNAKILSVDLSLKSLSYAKRKTEELEIKNVEYLHADILELNKLRKKFDVIEASGVLHHMEDPKKGLKILVDLLKSHGFLRLGLYSEIARKHIIEARKFVKKNKFKLTVDDIRKCRNKMINEKNNDLIKKVTKSPSFYTVSTLRDLIFHFKEHRFTLTHISKMLKDFNLIFVGFTDINPLMKKKFSIKFPEDKKFLSLKNWSEFEIENTDTFANMYNFWIRKR